MSTAALTWAFDMAGLSASEKLVLLVYANFANDRACAYPSNQTVCRLSGLNEKTVRSAIERLCAAGLLDDTGDRVGRTQQVRVYRLGIESQPETDGFPAPAAGARPASSTGARQHAPAARGPKSGGFRAGAKTTVSGSKGSRNRGAEPSGTIPLEDADASSAPQGARKKRAMPMAGDWEPPAVEDLPEPARTISRQWPAGAYASAAAGHRAHMTGSGRRAVDHAALWAARVVQLGAGPIRDGKAGLRYVEAPAGASCGTRAAHSEADYERTAAMFDKMGRHDDAAAMRQLAAGGR
ncbi:helix-turn-helix domain-containing protein [Sphingomonas sp. Leaf4]|uniref:helix-turn-helix domain-containing protein n=1 Tax=Sphingomonas sp. Leaf4 TaxID=2876553 RepID=UPI001E531331|nr:helix-turn-helix domain-containing protein [Sphingomonas sp. Leaf4]